MKNSQTLISSKRKYTLQILDAIQVQIEVIENPYELAVEELFIMAARINKKRSFLFISKVLGKHLPINPKKGLAASALLAARYMESVKGLDCSLRESLLNSFLKDAPFEQGRFIPGHINPVVIGFAETATALGHAFFDCFEQADFFHTTREELIGRFPVITFEEEHSHATSHRCYIPLELIENEREVVLVDDEMTTGRTVLNIIRSIHAKFPRKCYTVVSILDWRSKENQNKFSRLEQELGIIINVVSLLAGHVEVRQLQEIDKQSEEEGTQEHSGMDVKFIQLSDCFKETSYSSSNLLNLAPFIKETGRFGISSRDQWAHKEKIAESAALLKEARTGGKTLCLGTGEFMYLPMVLAAGMGHGIVYQSTTRSPIYINNSEKYGARFGISFSNPEDPEQAHFVYNIPPGYYDDLFIFFEREPEMGQLRPLLKELEGLQIPSVKLVFCSKARGENDA